MNSYVFNTCAAWYSSHKIKKNMGSSCYSISHHYRTPYCGSTNIPCAGFFVSNSLMCWEQRKYNI